MRIVGASILVCACLLSWFSLAFGQSQDLAAGPQAAVDCSAVGIDFIDDPNMSREERLEAMDRALQKSLGLYDLCQEIMSSEGAANSASGAGSGGMAGASSANGAGEKGESSASGTQGKGSAGSSEDGLAGETAEEASVASVATSDIQGAGDSKNSSGSVNKHGNPAQGDGVEAYRQNGQLTARKTGDKAQSEGGQGYPQKSSSGNNGVIPEDVQEADNDSVLEAQIREAALREKDPEVRARLWNEYRRYKGLPQKESVSVRSKE